MLNDAREVNHACHFRNAKVGKRASFRGLQESVHAELVVDRATFNPLESDYLKRGILSVHAVDGAAVEESGRKKRGGSVTAERDKLTRKE